MRRILLIGDDEMLLRTRAAILRHLEAEIVRSNAAAAPPILAEGKFDLVLLCHSLGPERSAALAEAIHSAYPGTGILQINSSRMWDDPPANSPVNAIISAEPEGLIRRTADLLQSRAQGSN